jgi:hydroxyacylglutathione hydrolase
MADRIPRSGRITDGFYLASFGFVCMYLLETNDGIVAFDAGLRAAGIRSRLAELGLDPAKVRHAFLTHSDSDHVGGLPALTQATVYLPSREASMLDRSTPRFFSFIFNKPFGRDYVAVEDDQVLSIGGATIRCLATPGHTAGHMSYLVNESLLIVGDVLNLADGKAVMDRKFINIDNTARRESLRRLAAIRGVSVICPMHSAYTTDAERAMREWA